MFDIVISNYGFRLILNRIVKGMFDRRNNHITFRNKGSGNAGILPAFDMPSYPNEGNWEVRGTKSEARN